MLRLTLQNSGEVKVFASHHCWCRTWWVSRMGWALWSIEQTMIFQTTWSLVLDEIYIYILYTYSLQTPLVVLFASFEVRFKPRCFLRHRCWMGVEWSPFTCIQIYIYVYIYIYTCDSNNFTITPAKKDYIFRGSPIVQPQLVGLFFFFFFRRGRADEWQHGLWRRSRYGGWTLHVEPQWKRHSLP